jgi:hypothetical protein
MLRHYEPTNKENLMPVFKDTAQLYDCVSGILEYLRDYPPARDAFIKSGLVIRFNYTAPDGEITIDGSHNPIELFCGPCDRVPTVDMKMSADTAHQFWLGKVNLVAALTRGTMTAKGPIPAIMKLLPAITPAYKRYPEILREKGLESLIDA